MYDIGLFAARCNSKADDIREITLRVERIQDTCARFMGNVKELITKFQEILPSSYQESSQFYLTNYLSVLRYAVNFLSMFRDGKIVENFVPVRHEGFLHPTMTD